MPNHPEQPPIANGIAIERSILLTILSMEQKMVHESKFPREE
jgi:hypothetical protein